MLGGVYLAVVSTEDDLDPSEGDVARKARYSSERVGYPLQVADDVHPL